MKSIALLCGFSLACLCPLLRAGSVTVLGDGPSVTGKLTLSSDGIEVQAAAAPVKIDLADVLEADFGDAPFQLNYFSSVGNSGNQLPSGWRAQNIGTVDTPGSVSYADGTFTLTGGGMANAKDDKFFFAGQQWTGDGVWTARVKEIRANPQAGNTEAGLMLRDGLDPNAMQVWAAARVTEDGMGRYNFRKKDGVLHSDAFSIQLPLWLRLTRSGGTVSISTSADGKTWGAVAHDDIESSSKTWVGLYVDSHQEKAPSKVIFDQVTFSPLPTQGQTIPPGVLLRDGSFLMGGIGPFNSTKGTLFTETRALVIPVKQVALLVFYPVARSQFVDQGEQSGLIMKNGDFLAGELEEAASGMVHLTSIAFGDSNCPWATIGACVYHQVQPQSFPYEIRLRDGSILHAKGFSADEDQYIIEDVSGISLNVAPEDIAQFRAGSASVESLTDLPWKVTAVPSAGAPTPNQNTPDPNSIVDNWTGNNQEQILAVPVQAPLEFPLTGKFRAVALRVALGPGAPPDAQATLQFQVNGKSIFTTPALKAGAPPLVVKVPIHDANTVSFVADSSTTGVKVLLIDPVAIRASGL